MYLEVQGNTITLPTGGGGNWGPKRYPNIVAHLTEDPPEYFHKVAVSRDARGNYYCSFVYDDAEQDGEYKPRKKRKRRKTRPMRDDGIVAFDLGIKKKEDETPKERRKRQIRKRMVYNDWGLYGFVQMLTYKCLRFGKALSFICFERQLH